MQEASQGKVDFHQLLAQAREAEARYDHETAVAAYTAALDLPDLTLEERYDILDGRSTTYYNWGIPDRIAAGAKSVIGVARKTGDKQRLAEAMAVHGFYWRNHGSDKPALKLEQEALHLADEQNDDRLRGFCLLALAIHAWNDGKPDLAWEHLDEGLAAARRSAADDILFNAVRLHAVAHQAFGRTDEALHFLSEMLALAYKSGSEFQRYQTLLLYGNTETDLAARRDYYEQAYQAEIAAAYRNGSSTSNIANLFWKLGLYGRALDFAASALQHAEVSGTTYKIGSVNDTLGKVLLAKGFLDEAEKVFKRGSVVAESNYSVKAQNVVGLAEIALARGRLSEAADHFQFARDLFESIEPVALAGLGLTHLALGNNEQAHDYSSKGVAFLEAGNAIEDYHEQLIWWRHYQVLKATGKEDPFWVLDRARQSMLAAIETLSDEGLRRNYLNEVAVNRDITLTWTAEAQKRGIALDPFTKHEPLAGNLRAQFRRVVDTGARLTAQHDPETLARFIVDEFVEMSGAERVLLVRDDGEGPMIIAGHHAGDAAEVAAPLLEKMRHSRQPILEQDACDLPTGAIPELHQRSLVALPLVASDRFLGMLYGDMRQIFGRFNEGDVQLLGMLANQAGAALENADLVSTLEDRVEQRTAELADAKEEAEAAREAAEGANEAKSAFMSNMSHELRTPLNAIIGFTRIVQRKARGVLPERQVDNLGKVLSSGEHLLGLINTILDIAKIEAGRMDVIDSRFSIGQLIEAAAAISQPLLKPGVALKLDISPDLPDITSDQDKIKQILLNLLSNAAKFTHEGSITVSAHVRALPEAPLQIDVTDTGIGMSEAALGRVFEEFQQADSTTRKKYGGTGLGMPISKHLAQLLGGDLNVTSSEGEGSTFTLTLPIDRAGP